MRLFFASVRTAFKKYLNMSICAVSFFYIVITSVYALYVNTYGVEAINVGIFSEIGRNEVIDNFFEGVDNIVQVEYYDSLDKMLADISRNKIQTGYAFSERGDYIYAYQSDRAAAASVSDFLLSAVVTQEVAGIKGFEVIGGLAAKKGLDKENVINEVQERINEYLNETGDIVLFEYANELPLAVDSIESAQYIAIHTFVWSFVFIVLLLDTLKLNKERCAASLKAMKVNLGLYFAGQFTGIFIISAMFYTLSVLVLSL